MPEISVIVPVYNVEAYLVRCIDSILVQTFTNFELILVDDGSTDGCGAICDEYTARDGRVRTIHQENRGVAATRNRGIDVARGRWICFVDSDDIAHPQMLELLLKAAENTGAKISMCGAVEGAGLPLNFMREVNSNFSAHAVDDSYLLHLYENVKYRIWTVWAKLIDKELLLKYPFTLNRIYEDNAVVCKWLVEAKIVCNMDTILYFYRVNPQGITKSVFKIKHLDYLWALRELCIFFRSINYPTMRQCFCSLFMVNAAGYYLKARDAGFPLAVLREIRGQMRSVKRENRGYFVFSRQQKLLIYDVMYPKRMKLYWLGRASFLEWKKNGLLGVINKVIKRITKEVKKHDS